VIAKLVLAAVAAAAIVFLGTRLHSDQRCTSAQRTIFRVTVRRAPAGQLAPALSQLRDSCRGTTALVSAAGGLTFSGRSRQAAALARAATHEEPSNWAAWAALAYAVRRTDPAGAAAARARVHRLNPRYRFAAAPRATGP
jgi:hypothetical protein